jgi:ATP phosphoribosyltransferase
MRLALPKGRLLEGVLALLARAGLPFTFQGARDYRPACGDPDVAARLFKPRAIPPEYPGLAGRWALRHNLAHIALQTWGSTEAYAPDDADVVLDCVETGRTLEANGLVVLERVARSATHLAASRAALDDASRAARIHDLARRLEGLVHAGHRHAD